MHTMKLPGGWYAQHNGYFSGVVALGNDQDDGRHYNVPFSVLKCLVAAWVAQERVKAIQSEEDANKILLPELPLLSLHK